MPGEAILQRTEYSGKTLGGRGSTMELSAPTDSLAGGEGLAAPSQELNPRSQPSAVREKLQYYCKISFLSNPDYHTVDFDS